MRWQEADLAVAPLTITAAREQMIDFSTPFFDLGLSILIARAERGDAQLAYAFLEPFALDTVRCAHVPSLLQCSYTSIQKCALLHFSILL